MGRPLRRREARLLQSGAALLLPGLVGGRLDAVCLRQFRQVECAAEGIPGNSHASRPLRQYLDDRKIRSAQSAGAQALARRRHQAARVLAAHHGSELQSGQELHSEISQTNAAFKKVYESMTDWTNNGYQWFRVAELTYDSFMVRHST